MGSIMEALVKYANTTEAVEIREMPLPQITANQVLLRVRAVGICGRSPKLPGDHRR